MGSLGLAGYGTTPSPAFYETECFFADGGIHSHSAVMTRVRIYFSSVFLVFFIVACATTPITGRRAFIALSEADENAEGEKAYREILSKERRTSNMTLAQQVEKIGRRIAAVSERPDFQWEFTTLDSKTPNAFCLPGGKVAVYTGIIPYAANEAGLATVMGHEIGHALARHGGQRITQQLGIGLGLTLLGATLLSDSKHQRLILGAIGAGATIGFVLPYSRDHESEADEIGLVLMARAGYDPREAPRFWDRFSKASGGKEPPQWLSTHPNSQNRRDRLQELLVNAIPVYDQARDKVGLGTTVTP